MSMHKKMIYRLGGSFKIGDSMFEIKTIDQDVEGELQKHLDDGWFETPNDAIIKEGVKELSALIDAESDEDDARDKLEQKAKELGIGFNVRTTNETLSQRIAEALEG